MQDSSTEHVRIGQLSPAATSCVYDFNRAGNARHREMTFLCQLASHFEGAGHFGTPALAAESAPLNSINSTYSLNEHRQACPAAPTPIFSRGRYFTEPLAFSSHPHFSTTRNVQRDYCSRQRHRDLQEAQKHCKLGRDLAHSKYSITALTPRHRRRSFAPSHAWPFRVCSTVLPTSPCCRGL